MQQAPKRLYVGGLGHAVSEAELRERFGKFGHVLDTEIITRQDDQGNPLKAFAYITVSISDADLRKCMTVLNKTKWKGGTLQIQLAKESFLHRLAREREEAKLQKEKPQRNGQTPLLESLKKVGVVDFFMKAVPGTEVPDHKGRGLHVLVKLRPGLKALNMNIWATKKWVVGKFGRVLPILHLRNQQKKKVMKYDPSKYCHNLRKLEADLTNVVPVSERSWHLEERGDSINTKRKGESPAMKKPPKKLRQLGNEALNGAVVLPSGCQSTLKTSSSPQLDQRSNRKPKEKSKLPPLKSLNSKVSGRGVFPDESSVSCVTLQNNTSVSDSDIDSEGEIRAMVERQKVQKAENGEAETDHLEIAGDHSELKYSSYWSLSNPDAMKQAIKGSFREKKVTECDNGYQSSDTDEIISKGKTPHLHNRNSTVLDNCKPMKVENEEILTEKKRDLVNKSSVKTHNLKDYVEKKGKKQNPQTAALQSAAGNSTTKASDSESSCSEPEKEESESSLDYECMMQNCYHLDLTLDDLQELATGTRGEESGSTLSSSQCGVEEYPKGNGGNKTNLSKFSPAIRKECICPEDIVAAIFAGEEDTDEASFKGQNNPHLKYQPFRGMGSLCEKELPRDSAGLEKRSVERSDLEACVSSCGEESSQRQQKNHPMYSVELGSEKQQNAHCEPHEELSDAASFAGQRGQPVSRQDLQRKNKGASSARFKQNSEHGDAASRTDQCEDESSDVDSNAAVSKKHTKQQRKSPRLHSKQSKEDVSNQNPEREADKHEDRKRSFLENKELCLHATASKERRSEKKQLRDNQRRLAALGERQRERELQNKLIQGALSNLDSQPAGKHKHVIFHSDVESEAEVDETLKKDAGLGSMHEDDKSTPKTLSRLFDSSEDEQDDMDAERFKIKPQFEGKAGEKLLKLQSRLGTDERFRMDARFLESDSEEEAEANVLKADEEEELAAEKKKNLEILGSLLNINLEHPKLTKKATSAKKFKDINALRYDPTREDHAVFERKRSATEQESKAKRKKEREESEKLPEVSQETYYDIAVDLKELFGSSKSISHKNEETPWDKDDVEGSAPPDHLGPVGRSNVAEESGGFKFSFFGDMEESGTKGEPYILETIKPVKVKWQEDPRFQDSSSEGDDEPEASESKNDEEIFFSLPRTECARSFFFSKDDERLREGPKLFCKSVDLSEERDNWEDRRRSLLEECRKKHKDARRKVKARQ